MADEILHTIFEEQKKKLDTVLAHLQTEAQEKSPEDPARYLKQLVRNPGDHRDRGASLEQRLRGHYKSLERLRLDALDDVIDWFRMRVMQVEHQIKVISRRQSPTDSIPDRIARVDSDAGVQAALAELDTDVIHIGGMVDHDPIAPKGKDQKFFAEKLKRRKAAAERMRDNVRRSIERMRLVLQTDKRGRNQLEQQVDRLIEGIPEGADIFMAEARRQTVGLSPEEERDFLEAINGIFDDIGGEVEGKFDSTERRASVYTRWQQVNQTAHVTERYLDGRVYRQRLIRAPQGSEIKVADEYVPENVDEVFAKAKQDAIVLGQLRQKLRRTFAIMGPVFSKVVRGELKGMTGADQIDSVDQMNQALSAAQEAAVKLAKADETFKAGLGERDVKELRWSNAADQPLITTIRTHMFEALKLGTLDKPDGTAIAALFELPPDADTVQQEQEVAVEQAALEPVLPEILAGKVSAGIVAEVFPHEDDRDDVLPEDITKEVRDKLKQIRDAADSSPFREAVIAHFNLALRDGGITTAAGLIEIIQKLDAVHFACAELNKYFGRDWAQASGLLIDDPAQAGKLTVSLEILEDALIGMAEGEHLIDTLKLDAEPIAQAQLLGKVDSPVRARLDRIGIDKQKQLYVALLGISREKGVPSLHPATALKRLGKALEVGAAGKTGKEALVHLNLITLLPDEPDGFNYNKDAIRLVITSKEWD